MSNPNDYLQSVLNSRDEKLGIGGELTFSISVKSKDGFIPFISIPNLTNEAARNLFDLFDENNICSNIVNARIQILKGKEEVDLNFLPNIHTVE